MKGWDGAPAWATLTDDAPACQFTGRDLAPNVSRAFQSFYFDRNGIQTALVHAWEVIAGNFADNSTVIGYDLLNEPNFAETPPITSTLLLANYYANYGDWRKLFTEIDEIDKVTAEDVQRAAKQYFVPSNRTIALTVQPAAAKEGSK